jgi:hypothetical protein
MFTKLATLADGRRRHRAALAPAHSNAPRRTQPRAATPRRAGRYVLMCRWLAAPATGKLECRWQIEPVVETPAEVPTPRWMKDDGPRGSAIRLQGKRARPERAA